MKPGNVIRIPLRVKVIVIGLLTIVFQLKVFCQPIQYQKMAKYDVVSNALTNTPIWVIYEIDRPMIDCSESQEYLFQFTTASGSLVPDLSGDYYGSGYDRGHMMPAAHNRCSDKHLKESYYYVNVAPQSPSLNRGVWRILEENERRLAKKDYALTVMCGTFGEFGVIGDRNKIVVPEYYWKIIIELNKLTGHRDTVGYWFPNFRGYQYGDLKKYKRPYKEIETSCQLHIKDMVGLYQNRDVSSQIAYMLSSIVAEQKMYIQSLNKFSERLAQLKNAYPSDEVFRTALYQNEQKLLSQPQDEEIESWINDVKLSQGTTLDQFTRSKFIEYKSTVEKQNAKYLAALRENKNDLNFVFERFFNRQIEVLGLFFKPGYCCRCGLPLTFPICAAAR